MAETVITPMTEEEKKAAEAAKGATGGRKTRGATMKQLKKMLKKAGLKTTGRKAALTRRAKKAHLKIRGGGNGEVVAQQGGMLTPLPYPGGGQEGGKKKRGSRKGFKLF